MSNHKCDESCVPWCPEWKKVTQCQQSKHECNIDCAVDSQYCNTKYKQPYPSKPFLGGVGLGGTGSAGNTRTFPTGATRDVDNSKLDYEGFLSPFVLERFSQYMHECRLRNIPEGQTVRSSDNWQKGMPFVAYMKSLVRHVVDAWKDHRAGVDGATNSDIEKRREDTLCAIIFNAQGYLQELLVRRNAAYRPK